MRGSLCAPPSRQKGSQPNGAGQWTDYRMVEKYDGADKRTLTVYQLGVMTARPIKLVEMVLIRRLAG